MEAKASPPRPAADSITRESYTHELWSAGFWPGDLRFPEPAFYAYAAPAPTGFSNARVRPAAARWNNELGEFLLPWEEVRRSRDPRAMAREFLQSTYEAAANLGEWDRQALEVPHHRGHPPEPATIH